MNNEVKKEMNEDEKIIRQLCKKIVEEVIIGEQDLPNTINSGNYGEMYMDYIFEGMNMDYISEENRKFKRISKHRVTSLTQKNNLGIDGVYRNSIGEKPKYVIGESKYNTAELEKPSGIKQMSAEWVLDRLDDAVGREIADDIKDLYYMKPEQVVLLVFNTSKNNKSYTFKCLNDLGNVKVSKHCEG